MSLTSILKSSIELRKLVPNFKTQMVDFDGKVLSTANWKTPIQVDSVGKPHEAGAIGTAFDYLARAILTQQVGRDNAERRRPLARESLSILIRVLSSQERNLAFEQDVSISSVRRLGVDLALRDESELLLYMYKRLQEAEASIEEFIDGDASLEALVPHALFMAHLDTVYRSGSVVVVDEFLKEKQGKSYFGQKSTLSPEELAINTLQLAKLFDQTIRYLPMRQVSLNPIFEPYSSAVGGADADFIFDSTLIDLKSTSKLAYSSEDVAQIFGYAAMALATGKELERCGIYFARFGVTALIEISPVVKEFLSEYLSAILEAAEHTGGNTRET